MLFANNIISFVWIKFFNFGILLDSFESTCKNAKIKYKIIFKINFDSNSDINPILKYLFCPIL